MLASDNPKNCPNLNQYGIRTYTKLYVIIVEQEKNFLHLPTAKKRKLNHILIEIKTIKRHEESVIIFREES